MPMNDNWIQRIYADCPILFRHCDEDSACRPALPLFVEAGWLPLMYYFCLELEKLLEDLRENGAQDDALPEIFTIKQEHAQLRCSLSNVTDEMHERVEKYAWLASRVCERCAKFGAKVRDIDKHYFVLCNPCTEIRVKEMKERLGC
jgi:hypothetical protein